MRNLINVSALLALLGWASPCLAQDIKVSIVGLWKVVGDVNKVVATGEASHPFGEHPNGYQLFSQGGHMMQLICGEGRKAPSGQVPTEKERAELFNSLQARSGQYEVSGTKVVIRFDGSESHSVNGSTRAYIVEINGSRMTLTAEPFIRPRTGQQVTAVLTLERAE